MLCISLGLDYAVDGRWIAKDGRGHVCTAVMEPWDDSLHRIGYQQYKFIKCVRKNI